LLRRTLDEEKDAAMNDDAQEMHNNGLVRRGVCVILGGGMIMLLLTAMTWIAGAGGILRDVENIKSNLKDTMETNAYQEQRITRLEVVYERTGEDIREIKTILQRK